MGEASLDGGPNGDLYIYISVKPHEIFKRVDTDNFAKLTKERLVKYFGKGLSYVTNILDPECIVLGGGVSNTSFLYTEGSEELSKWIFNPSLDIPIKKAELGDSAGVFGAGLL